MKISLDTHQSADNPVRPYVTEYLQATKASAASRADIVRAKQKLFRDLLFVIKRDLIGLDLASFHRVASQARKRRGSQS
jgi:hypothetical protein